MRTYLVRTLLTAVALLAASAPASAGFKIAVTGNPTAPGTTTVTTGSGQTGSVYLTLTVDDGTTLDLAFFMATVSADPGGPTFTSANYPGAGYVFTAAESAGLSTPFDLNLTSGPSIDVSDYHMIPGDGKTLTEGTYTLAELVFAAPVNTTGAPVSYTLSLSNVMLTDRDGNEILGGSTLNGTLNVSPAGDPSTVATPAPPPLVMLAGAAGFGALVRLVRRRTA